MSDTGWSDALASGSDDLDAQHRAFFSAVDRFRAAPATKESVAGLLEFLSVHAHEHFSLEEVYMAAYHYPEVAAHREAHRGLTEQLARVRARFEAEGPAEAVVKGLDDAVNVWLRGHIGGYDRPFVEFLKQQPDAPEPP